MTNFINDFATNVRTIRKKLDNMSQEQLAEKVGVSIQTISSIENGKHYPSYNVLLKLANALQTHPAKLMIGDCEFWTIEDKELQYILVETFKDLSPKQREIALKLVHSVSEMEL